VEVIDKSSCWIPKSKLPMGFLEFLSQECKLTKNNLDWCVMVSISKLTASLKICPAKKAWAGKILQILR